MLIWLLYRDKDKLSSVKWPIYALLGLTLLLACIFVQLDYSFAGDDAAVLRGHAEQMYFLWIKGELTSDFFNKSYYLEYPMQISPLIFEWLLCVIRQYEVTPRRLATWGHFILSNGWMLFCGFIWFAFFVPVGLATFLYGDLLGIFFGFLSLYMLDRYALRSKWVYIFASGILL